MISQEIVTALNGKKNIVPVTDNFTWPDPMSLPEDMRAILNFNGVKWVIKSSEFSNQLKSRWIELHVTSLIREGKITFKSTI